MRSTSVVMRLAVFTAIVGAMVVTGCQYSLKEEPPVAAGPTVTVSPDTASLYTGEMQQFTATVIGSTDKGVRWSIVSGPGTIDTSGLYQTPITIATDKAIAVIRATSTADSTSIGEATVIVKGPDPYDGVCFRRDVLPIFNNKCSNGGCHDVNIHAERYILSVYSDTTIDGETFRGVHSLSLAAFQHGLTASGDDRMPPLKDPQLTQAQIDTIVKWYNEGAKETDCPGNPRDCDTSNVSYVGTIKPILENYCIGCHTGATSLNSRTDLARYDSLHVMALDGRLINSIDQAEGVVPMPQNGDRLSDCLIRQFKAWVNKGAPNN